MRAADRAFLVAIPVRRRDSGVAAVGVCLQLIPILILAFIIWALFLSPIPQGVSVENYEQIRKGMTLPEVEKLLGSGKELLREEGSRLRPAKFGEQVPNGPTLYKWASGNTEYIIVGFEEGRASCKTASKTIAGVRLFDDRWEPRPPQ